jgi:porphobilinogen synthase
VRIHTNQNYNRGLENTCCGPAEISSEFELPVAAYNVSGEYAMIKAAHEKGWLDGSQAMVETLTSIKRAGADLILSYFSREYAELNLD